MNAVNSVYSARDARDKKDRGNISLVLVNGGTISPPEITTDAVKSVILTHGGKDADYGNRDFLNEEQIKIFKNGFHLPVLVYSNNEDGHVPRSLMFPTTERQDVLHFRDCSVKGTLCPGGNHRDSASPPYSSFAVHIISVESQPFLVKEI